MPPESPKTVFVVPREGLRVLYPDCSKALPSEGADVPRNGYWTLRLRDGDVAEKKAEAPAPKTKQG